MDDLELVVSDGELDEQREVTLVEEALEVAQRSLHLVRRRRYEHGVLERAATDPDRARSQLARAAMLPAYSTIRGDVHENARAAGVLGVESEIPTEGPRRAPCDDGR